MPKKTPPSLPLSAFSPVSPAPLNFPPQFPRRSFPRLLLDAHVFLHLHPPHDPASAAVRWKNDIANLRTRLLDLHSPLLSSREAPVQPALGLPGFIFLHRLSPAFLASEPLFQLASAAAWVLEAHRIVGLDETFMHFDPCPPLAQVVCAPLHLGPQVLSHFLDKLISARTPVVGCLHFIQPLTSGYDLSMTNPNFVSSLRLLGQRGLGVELTVDGDSERSAPVILEEILECVTAVRRGQPPSGETSFVLCQIGKPETISSRSNVPSSASYSSILTRLFSLSLFSNLHIKLSSLPLLLEDDLTEKAFDYFASSKRPCQAISLTGLPPEAPSGAQLNIQPQVGEQRSAGHAEGEQAWREVKKRLKFYLEPILEAFGDHRIMYSSDYPVFGASSNSAQTKPVGTYDCKFEMYLECLTELGLANEALDNIFGLNAMRWYRIEKSE